MKNLSCGHFDSWKPDGWYICYGNVNGKGRPYITSEVLCTKCYIKEIKENPFVLHDEWEIQDWLIL